MEVKFTRLMAAAILFGAGNGAIAQTTELQKRDDALLMVASYLGIAEFCTAYGVDFRNVAAPVISGFRDNILPSEDSSKSIAFDAALRAGKLGRLYSPQLGAFVDLPKQGANMVQVCSQAHQQVLLISKMK